jgi:phosphatidylserine/phosphatidylglycerophosphate/cardiolipin synthase-like enzyme
VINEKAVGTLKLAGVDVRVDPEERLLHSKFLVIDSDLSIVGSHNWSAGSYFGYDDVTFALQSEGFAQQLHERFNSLWAAGS